MVNQLNIVQIVRSPAGGIRKHILALINGLSDKNYNFYLITNESLGDSDFFKYLNNINKDCEVINIPFKKLPGIRDIGHFYRLFKYFKGKNILAFHGHGAIGGIYSRLLSLLLRSRSLYTPHGGSMHSMHGLLSRLYLVIEWCMYWLTTHFIFESKYSLEMFKLKVKKESKKYLLNLNGVTIGSHQPKKFINNEAVKIASFGALRKIKGYDLIIKAMALLRKNKYNIEYSLYGTGEEFDYLKGLSKELNLEDRVKFMGEVSNSNLEMNKFDIIIQPSYFESFGYTIIEAMAQGVPVIASRAGGMKEIIENGVNGLSFDCGNIDGLADSIKLLCDDQSLYNKLAVAGQKSVKEKFSEKRMVEFVGATYRAYSSGS